MSYNDRSLPPLRLPSRLPDVTHVTLSPRPSPFAFVYCKQSKTGGGNNLGTRLLRCFKYRNVIKIYNGIRILDFYPGLPPDGFSHYCNLLKIHLFSPSLAVCGECAAAGDHPQLPPLLLLLFLLLHLQRKVWSCSTLEGGVVDENTV